MKYPPEVKIYVDFLNNYSFNDDLVECDIMHIYAEGMAFPNGYYDSQFFTLVIYNTKTMERREMKSRDGIDIETKKANVKMLRVFADGSTLVRFDGMVNIGIFQSVQVRDI